MAQSPVNEVRPEEAKDYLGHWDALSTMITRGRSFSGRERHCAFLNTRGQSFANVSGGTGLDLIDDGRGLAVCDWDNDGDLDLWITQRNGPRVRFLRNELSENVNALSVRLEGATCNRDAIGARVLAETSSGRKLVRTLRAGDSFLSQSSKLLHFGLASSETVLSLAVSWPGETQPETFPIDGMSACLLVQGAGVSKPEDRKRSPEPLASSVPKAPDSPDSWRLVLLHRKELPEIKYVDFEGDLRALEPNGPTLVTLWASWCAPCVKELTALAEAEETFGAKNLRIVALCTDALVDGDARADLGPAKALVAKSGYPFDLGLVDAGGAQALSGIHYRTLAVQRPLSLPSSFLTDASGRIGVLYQGPVSVDQLLADIDLLGSSGNVTEAAAFPFPGRNGVEHFTLTPLTFAQAYHTSGDSDAARAYLSEQLAEREGTLKELYFLGTLEQSQGHWEAAVAAYGKVLKRSPQHPAIRVPLGVALWKAGRLSEAKEHFNVAEALGPERPTVWAELGRAHLQIGLPADAVTYFNKGGHRQFAAKALLAAGQGKRAVAIYETLLKENPQAHQVKNDLAWILATHPEISVRNAKRALDLANQLAKLSGFRDLYVLDTLSAAQANTGNFEEAIKQATTARRLARAVGLTKLAEEMSDRLRAYRSKQPFRK